MVSTSVNLSEEVLNHLTEIANKGLLETNSKSQIVEEALKAYFNKKNIPLPVKVKITPVKYTNSINIQGKSFTVKKRSCEVEVAKHG